MIEAEYDIDNEIEKAGSVEGVVRLKPGQEMTLMVIGPVVECLDRFGDKPASSKQAMGVFVIDTGKRGVVILSWKALKEWQEESKRRPLKTHLLRYSRTGSGQTDTKYQATCVSLITPQNRAALAAAAPLDVKDVAAQITKRALQPRASTPAAGQQQQGYPHPGNGGTASAPSGGAPGTVGTQNGGSYVPELLKLDGAIASGYCDMTVVAEKVKLLLAGALGKERVVALRNEVGGKSGEPLTSEQVREAIKRAIAILQPPKTETPVAAGMGVADDEIPF